jgi:serine/threonine-protein kinase
MITGRPPFLASAPQLWTDLLQKEPTDPRVVVAQLPDELVEIVRKAMSKRPADRYPSARAMSDALSAFLAGRSTRSLLPAEPTLAPTATATVDPAPAPAPRRRASWAPLVLVLGGLFAALTFGGLALLAWSLLASPEALAPTPAPMSDPQPPDRATPTVPSSGAPGAAAGSPTPPMRPIAPVPAVAPQPVVPGARSVSTTCAHYQRRACSCPSRPGLCAEARREVDGWQRELAHDPAQIERACASALASAERDCDSGGLVEPWPPPSPRR